MGGIISTIRDLKVILKDLKVTLKFTAKIVLKVHGIVDDMEHTMQELKSTVNGLSSRLPKSPCHGNVEPLSIAYINDVVNSIEHKAESVKLSLSNAVAALTKDDLIGNTSNAWETLLANKRLSDVMTKWASVPDGLGDLVKQDCEKLKEMIHNVEESLPLESPNMILEMDESSDNKNIEKRMAKESTLDVDNHYDENFSDKKIEKKDSYLKLNALENQHVEKSLKLQKTISSEDIEKVIQFICEQPIFKGKKFDVPDIIVEEVLDNKVITERGLSLKPPFPLENTQNYTQWINLIVKLLKENHQHRKPTRCDKIADNTSSCEPHIDIQKDFLSFILIGLLQGIKEHGALEKCQVTDLLPTSGSYNTNTAENVSQIIGQ